MEIKMLMKIQIKYFVDDLITIEKIAQGDWIDLRAAEDAEMRRGSFVLSVWAWA